MIEWQLGADVDIIIDEGSTQDEMDSTSTVQCGEKFRFRLVLIVLPK